LKGCFEKSKGLDMKIKIKKKEKEKKNYQCQTRGLYPTRIVQGWGPLK